MKTSNIKRRKFIKLAGLGTSATLLNGSTSTELLQNRNTDKPNTDKPNIVYIMADQHRFDALGVAGNNVIKTPNLDKMAQDGVIFSSAYSSTPSCTPARSGLLTGMSPWNHGMLGYSRVSQYYFFMLPQALKNAGYYTFGIGKNHWYPQKVLHGFHETLVDESGRVETSGFVSDYRKWFKQVAPGLNPDATGVGWNDYRARVYKLDEKLHPTTWTAQTAVDFIDNYKKSDPFLLKVSFARPHSPYDPPQRFMDMYKTDDMPAPDVGEWAKKYAPRSGSGYDIWHGDLGVKQAKESRKGYYGAVTFIDEQIGKIITALNNKGIYDNTLIVFFSDHGDMLGDHHMWRKTYAYEGSTHIPMILKWPQGVQAQVARGSTITNPVEIRDVLPTFLDAAGVNIPQHIDGQSMLKLVRGESSDWREYIDLEHSVCYSSKNHWNALTDGKIKYIFFAKNGSEQLFDLTNDPSEKKDLSNDSQYTSILKIWRERMVNHLKERGTEYVRSNKLVSPRKNRLLSPNYPTRLNQKPQPVSYMKTNLFECGPNPFRRSISIRYVAPRNCRVTIDIMDVAGKKVITLQNRFVIKGSYSAVWNGIDKKGIRVSTGTYYCRMKAGNLMSVKKVVLVK